MSARKKRAAKSPDLDSILGAFSDAYSLISVVNKVIERDANCAAESMVLRLGVEALNRAYNRLDEAIVQLSELREAS